MYRDFAENGKPLPSSFESRYLSDKDNNIMKELYSSSTFPSFETVMRADLEKHYANSDLQEPSFIRRGIYIDQIRRFMNIFGESQVKVYGFKDLIGSSKQEILNDVLTFVGLKPITWDGYVKDDKKNKRVSYKYLQENLTSITLKKYRLYDIHLIDFKFTLEALRFLCSNNNITYLWKQRK